MTVSAKDDDTGARGYRPHCFEDDLAFVEVVGPGICAAKPPIAGERDGRDDELPLHTLRFTAGEEGEEMGELFWAQHGFLTGVCGEGLRRGAIATGVHEEEGGGTMGELEVGCLWCYRRRVDGSMVDVPGVGCGGIGGCGVTVPIVSDLMIVHYVYPGQVLGNGRPVWGTVDLTVFAAVGFWVATESSGDVNVDEVAEEEHEGGFQTRKPLS